MSERDLAALDRWLRCHHGVVHRRGLKQMGFTGAACDRLIRSQRFVRLQRGVYCSPAWPVGRVQHMVAACLRHPSAVIGFTTAGQEWGFRGMADEQIHAIVPHGSHLLLDHVVVHASRQLEPTDVTGRRADGIRLTSPPRTLLDAAALIGRDATESAIEQALAENRCSIATLMSTARRLRHSRRPGARLFDDVLASRPVWRGAARSELERLLRAAIEAAGLPRPLVNHRLVLDAGEPIEIDLAWPTWRVAVEVDHPFWHDGAAPSWRDKRRDRKLARMGWLPQRVTKADIEERLDEVLDDIAGVLAARGWEHDAA